MTHLRLGFCTIALAASMAGCGGSSDPDVLDSQDAQSQSSSSPEEPAEQGAIVESGFGQQGQYVWATAVVENSSDHGGQTVTVNFNILDKAGDVIASGSQVEAFSIAGQQVAVGTQVDLGPRVQASSMEPTLLVEDNGYWEESDVDLGTVDASSIRKEPYSEDQWRAKFTIQNPTPDALQSPRIGAVCHGADGKINGGGVDFPDLVPPSGEVVIDPYLITSGKPDSCLAYIAPGM